MSTIRWDIVSGEGVYSLYLLNITSWRTQHSLRNVRCSIVSSAAACAVPIIKLFLWPQSVWNTENALSQLQRVLMAKHHKLVEVFLNDVLYVYNRSLLTNFSENSVYETSRKFDVQMEVMKLTVALRNFANTSKHTYVNKITLPQSTLHIIWFLAWNTQQVYISDLLPECRNWHAARKLNSGRKLDWLFSVHSAFFTLLTIVYIAVTVTQSHC
jgi:hypothetical protein